jgi:adenylate cyclase
MFVFPDPGEAVAAAVRMVAEAPTAGLPDAHIGVAAGAVIAQDGDYYGRTVNLAARLAGHAGPRRILVDDEVIRLAGESFAHTPAGSISLKGFPEPIGAHQITT